MRRLVLAAAATALLVPATGAWAGKTVCNLVNDKADDTGLVSSSVPFKAPVLDIRSFDVATGKKTLVAVMRMGSMAQASDPVAALGLTWSASFKVNGAAVSFSRRIGPNGQVLSDTATSDGTALNGVVVKTDGKSISWTVQRGSIGKLKPGAKLTAFFSSTSAPTLGVDQAPDGGRASTATYVDKTPSCVRPA